MSYNRQFTTSWQEKSFSYLMCGRKFGVMSFGSSVFGAQVREVGGVAPKKSSITSRTLPRGLTLSNQGVISGTPTSVGNYTFTVKVTDVNSLPSSSRGEKDRIIGIPDHVVGALRLWKESNLD